MKVLRSPSLSGSDTHHAVRRAAALLPLILLATSLPVVAEESKSAVWKRTEVGFSYRSSLAIYSCSELEGRVAVILRAIGARDDIEVKATGCDVMVIAAEEPEFAGRAASDRFPSRPTEDRLLSRRSERSQSANVRVRLMMPTEVTPEILAELDRDKSRRELVSRVTGNSAAKLDDPIIFPAQRQPITLSRASIGLRPEECELLDQMSTGVFRRLGVRVVRRSLACDSDRGSRIAPKVTVEALVGIPIGTVSAPQLPPLSESEPDPSAPAASEAKPTEPATAPPQK